MITTENKVLLIRSNYTFMYKQYARAVKFFHFPPPTGLLYIAASLERMNIQNEILDAEYTHYGEREILNCVKHSKARVVGLTSTTLEICYVLSLAKQIKSNHPMTTVCIGGPHAIILPETIIKENYIDMVCCGEGETAFSQYVYNLFSGKLQGKSIPNVYYKFNSTIIPPPHNIFYEDLNDLPFLPLEKLNLSRYYFPAPPPIRKKVIFTSLVTSRGCPYSCAYCSKTMGSNVRFMTPERVVDEMEYLKNTFQIYFFRIEDESFIFHKKRVFEICKLIIQKSLNTYWSCFVRADQLDEELLQIMKKAGCIRITSGIESGNQKTLDLLEKNITIRHYRETYQMIRKNGIEARGSFIIGAPYERKEDIYNTIKFAMELVDHASFNIITPYPKTKIWDMAKNGEGIRILSENFSDYQRWGNAVVELPDVSREELIKLHKYAVRRFYIRPRTIIHIFKRFKFVEMLKSITHLIPSFR